MGTKINSNYSDLLTFTRASGGHALRPCTFTETAVNGGFDTDASWSKGIGWSIGSGVASIDGSQSAGSSLYQSKIVSAGDIIRMTVEVTAITSGTIAISYANGTGSLTASPYYATSSTGAIQRIFTVTGSGSVNFVVSGSTSAVASVDNVSIATVAFDQPDGTLTLFEHPNNVPRVEYDADRNRLGLLVEEQRTNLILNSSDFSAGSWTTQGASISAATNITAPDGTTNSFKLIESAGTAVHRVQGAPAAGGTTSTMSCFMKKAERSWGNINFSGLGNGQAWFDLENGVLGTVQSSVTARIEDYGNGWYRCSVTATPTSFAATDIKPANADDTTSYTGDGTSGIYVFGAQTEAGSFPTSYIKTTGSTATRSADVASIPVADFGYNQSEGTLFLEAQANSDSSVFRRFIDMREGATAKHWAIIGDTTQDVRMYHHNGTSADVNQDVLSNILDGNTMFKMAYAIKDNDAAASGNGGTVSTDTSVDFCVPTTMYIGSSTGSSAFACGHIKSIKYYPRRLTNAQLQDLTS